MAKHYIGQPPLVDDFGVFIRDAFVDGRTKYGPWATMTLESFEVHGVGLGTGKGQKYVLTEGAWVNPDA